MRPFLCRWEELPEGMRIPEVRPYWEALDARYGQLVAKRAFDVAGSLGLLVVLSPVMAAAAIAVKTDSPGPVMYRQERVTQYGRRFRIHKFRTMVANADKIGALVTTDRDPRITRVGEFLRKYRIDEFPQLLDIVVGDMTFVGTRPEVPKYVAEYKPEWLSTLLLPAGVTSRASIEFKDEAELIAGADNADDAYVHVVLPRKMQLNLAALPASGVLSDVRDVLSTIGSVFLSPATKDGV